MTRYIWTTVSFSMRTPPLRPATPWDRDVAGRFGVWLKVSAVQNLEPLTAAAGNAVTCRASPRGPQIG